MLSENPSRAGLVRRERINVNFNFRTSLGCLKRFYKGHKGLHKTVRGTTKERENKNLSSCWGEKVSIINLINLTFFGNTTLSVSLLPYLNNSIKVKPIKVTNF